MALLAEVLDDGGRSVQGDQGGDVVEGGVGGEGGFGGRGEEPLVCGLESHLDE